MRKGTTKLRISALTAALTVGISTFALPTAPASARPHDCQIRVFIEQWSSGLVGKARVDCANREDYRVEVIIRRKDGWTHTRVAFAGIDYIEQGTRWVQTSEPCSDVETTKQYSVKGILYDGRFGPPIDVKEVETGLIQGHC
ncbi:hypothetical protein [Rhizohabitans arisaemae]|uniref:hypothetical protein n=1 Tax=Rhizohabitans arisaemae TaxID=2720610 RepID=UPI0024B06EBD|nr:hypothetical protein [Rhizohabitans arisaemae]